MNIVVWPQQPLLLVQAIRDAAAGATLVTPGTEADALEAARTADGWVGPIKPEWFTAAKKLRWIQAWTLSLERVIFPEMVSSNVTLTNMRHIYDDHISNHVLALFLSLCREFPMLMQAQAQHKWTPRPQIFKVRDPGEMTVLILGLGGIGSETARRMAVLCPRVIGVDPKVDKLLPGLTELARPDRLPELLPRADATIICAPLTPETSGLFDEKMLGYMRATSFLINIGRGKIVKLAALERALEEGWIAGAALDVFETEPLPKSSKLWEMSNVIITPHMAGTGGSKTEERRLGVVLENVRRFVAGEPLKNVADKANWY